MEPTKPLGVRFNLILSKCLTSFSLINYELTKGRCHFVSQASVAILIQSELSTVLLILLACHRVIVTLVLPCTDNVPSVLVSAVPRVHHYELVPQREGPRRGGGPGAAAGGGREDGRLSRGAGAGGCHLPGR